MSQIEIGTFLVFFTPPLLGHCPKFYRFFLVTPPLNLFKGSRLIFGMKALWRPRNSPMGKITLQVWRRGSHSFIKVFFPNINPKPPQANWWRKGRVELVREGSGGRQRNSKRSGPSTKSQLKEKKRKLQGFALWLWTIRPSPPPASCKQCGSCFQTNHVGAD